MTDLAPDEIREAVRLADGWEQFNSVAVKCQGMVLWTNIYDEDENAQLTFDALAAQLVRQVDDHETASIVIDYIDEETQGYGVAVFDDADFLSFEYRSNRTTNTIRAILKSGVLK